MRFFRRGGFTLIELLVAVSITAVLSGLMIAVISSAGRIWGRSSGALVAGSQGRVAMDYLVRDLENAVVRVDRDAVWMAATIRGADMGSLLRSAGNQGNATEFRFGPPGVWLRFFTMVSGREGAQEMSRLGVVSYQVARSVNGGEVAYRLYRTEIGEESGGMERLRGLGYDLRGGGDLMNALNGSIADQDVVASHVVDFGVRFLKRGAGAGDYEVIFPRGAAETECVVNVAGGAAEEEMPDAVDVFLRVLTDEGARVLSRKELAGEGASEWDIVNANSRVYVQRVFLRKTGWEVLP